MEKRQNLFCLIQVLRSTSKPDIWVMAGVTWVISLSQFKSLLTNVSPFTHRDDVSPEHWPNLLGLSWCFSTWTWSHGQPVNWRQGGVRLVLRQAGSWVGPRGTMLSPTEMTGLSFTVHPSAN